jgi:hypothetical protein
MAALHYLRPTQPDSKRSGGIMPDRAAFYTANLKFRSAGIEKTPCVQPGEP